MSVAPSSRTRTALALSAWLERAWSIENNPRSSRHIYAAAARHLAAFPLELVSLELERETLASARRLFVEGRSTRFGRPPRGHRADHPTTAYVVAINNQLTRLERPGGRSNSAKAGECDRRDGIGIG